MENATKALLIAGSVLVVIVLIAIGIKILGSTTGVTDEVDRTSEAMGVSIFNSNFTKYAGTQSASEVKDLISQVAATHRTGSDHKINLVGTDGNTYTTANAIAGVMTGLQINSTYKVTITKYDGDGYITEVKIEK